MYNLTVDTHDADIVHASVTQYNYLAWTYGCMCIINIYIYLDLKLYLI